MNMLLAIVGAQVLHRKVNRQAGLQYHIVVLSYGSNTAADAVATTRRQKHAIGDGRDGKPPMTQCLTCSP